MKKRALIVLVIIMTVTIVTLTMSCKSPDQTTEIEKTEEETTSAAQETPKPTEELPRAATPEPIPNGKQIITIPEPLSETIAYGSYTGTLYQPDEPYSIDVYLQIHDDTSGAMFICNLDNNQFEAKDFTYTDEYIGEDRILTFNFDDGEKLECDLVYGDTGYIMLWDINAPGVQYDFRPEYDGLFTAFGSWITVKEDGTIGYISFWPNKVGYASKWEDIDDETVFFEWWYNSDYLQFDFNDYDGYYEEKLVEHMGSAAVLYRYNEEDMIVMCRARSNVMCGYYTLQDSDDTDRAINELYLQQSHNLNAVIIENGEKLEDNFSGWYIDPVNGNFHLQLTLNDQLEYYYFYSGDELLLVDVHTGYYYSFVKRENP